MSIPKIIHYCWFGNAPKPESVIRCISSWRKYCPDYEIKEWNESNIDLTMNEYTQQAYEAKAWGFVPDYLRLWIVFNYGGIYLDTDVQVLKNFDALLDNKAFAGFEKDTGDFFNFGQGFGAEAGNKIIEQHMHLYDDLKFKLEDGSYNKMLSPQYTTRILEQIGLNRRSKEIQILEEITIYPEEYFCPKSFTTGVIKRTHNSYSVHHFDSSWFTENEKKARELRRKAARKDYIMHTPNRWVRKLLGDNMYQKMKSILKNEK